MNREKGKVDCLELEISSFRIHYFLCDLFFVMNLIKLLGNWDMPRRLVMILRKSNQNIRVQWGTRNSFRFRWTYWWLHFPLFSFCFSQNCIKTELLIQWLYKRLDGNIKKDKRIVIDVSLVNIYNIHLSPA